jgi:hypothetical protein
MNKILDWNLSLWIDRKLKVSIWSLADAQFPGITLVTKLTIENILVCLWKAEVFKDSSLLHEVHHGSAAWRPF